MAQYGTGASSGQGQEKISSSTKASKRKLPFLQNTGNEAVPF